MKQFDPETDLIWKKLSKYNLIPHQSVSGEEAVKIRKKVKRGITDSKNDTIKILIKLVNEMNGSIIKQQKRIMELSNKIDHIKERSPRPMPDRAYIILQQENEKLRDELDWYKNKFTNKTKTHNLPKPDDIYGTPLDLHLCQDDSPR